MILAAIAAFFATAPRLYAGATLPKTATDAEIRIFFGLLLGLVSLFLLVIRRRHLVPAVRHGR
jgi:LPXTG-motif cell wall-anchored protein